MAAAHSHPHRQCGSACTLASPPTVIQFPMAPAQSPPHQKCGAPFLLSSCFLFRELFFPLNIFFTDEVRRDFLCSLCHHWLFWVSWLCLFASLSQIWACRVTNSPVMWEGNPPLTWLHSQCVWTVEMCGARLSCTWSLAPFEHFPPVPLPHCFNFYKCVMKYTCIQDSSVTLHSDSVPSLRIIWLTFFSQ